jgi:hypothetical protein
VSREREDVHEQETGGRAPAPAPQVAAPASGPLLRTPAGAMSPRVVASGMGNAAFSRLMRAPRVAADAASAAGMAPDGPLAQLRDELDDTFVDEDKCIGLLGQLGDGERILVGRDATMLQQMADAFDAGEMARAIEHVTLTVKWQMHWLSQAASLTKYDQAVLTRLLERADAAAFGELIGWDEVREKVRGAWHGNPLQLPLTTTDPVATRGWLANAGFMAWCIQRAGPPAIVQWMVANDHAATLTAIKAGGTLTALLDALRDQPVIRPALKLLFVAATTPDDRRRLYEIRFDTRAAGTIDWMANGEALWTQQELATGTGGDRAAVEAQVAAGGPQNVADAIAADAKSPLVELRDELDDTFVDEDLCLGLIARLTDREALLLTRDATLMGQIADAFNGAEMSRVLERVGHLMALKDALAWIEQANESGDVDASVTFRLIAASNAQDIAEVIGYPQALTSLKRTPGVRPITLTPLLADAAKRDHVVQSYGAFIDWVVDAGDASGLLRLVSTNAPGGCFTALQTAGKAEKFVKALPKGSAMPVADRVALRLLFRSGTDVPIKILMLNQRYNLDRTGEDTPLPGAGTFESATLDRMWDVLERVPEADLADNEWLKELTRRTNPDAPTPQGVTGSDRVAIGYDPAHLGDAESGEFADPGDQMSGTNLFDTTLLHEMAHASDRQYGWTRDGGPFDTDVDLGAWQDHRLDYTAIVDRLAADTSLATAFPVAAELADVKTALVDVMTNKSTNAESGFQNQAGPAYGVGADKWKPLWTRVSGHAIVPAIQDGQASKSPWNHPPAAVAGRIYHDTDYRYWASYASATRAGGKLSRYQFRDKRDFFAETYATYYETAPADPGRLVRAWNNRVYEWFRANVDRGQETQAAP